MLILKHQANFMFASDYACKNAILCFRLIIIRPSIIAVIIWYLYSYFCKQHKKSECNSQHDKSGTRCVKNTSCYKKKTFDKSWLVRDSIWNPKNNLSCFTLYFYMRGTRHAEIWHSQRIVVTFWVDEYPSPIQRLLLQNSFPLRV